MKEIAALIGILVAGVPVTPQRPPQFEMEIKTIKLTDNLYVLEGAGGNVAAFVWDDGVLLVDDKLAPASPKVKAAVATITPRPIRFVVNSHWHRDHSGGNEALAGDGSVIVAHENVRRRVSVDGFVAVFDRKVPASFGGGGQEPRAGEGRAAHKGVGRALPELVRHVRPRRGGSVSRSDVTPVEQLLREVR